jgi:hypothetical protein
MSKGPECPTPHSALTQALAAAIIEPLAARLSEARFGMYAAEGAGWNWNLEFRYSVGDSGRQDPDRVKRRVEVIVECWRRDVAAYDTPIGAEE